MESGITEKKAAKEFTDLLVWQASHALVTELYKETRSFPKKEKTQFYYLAHGSLTELKNQLLIARDVGYLPAQAFDSLTGKLSKTHQLLRGLIKKSASIARPNLDS